MVLVFFLYGLAFFLLGINIFVYPRRGSSYSMARNLRFVGLFGLLHGTNEWVDMFLIIGVGEPMGGWLLELRWLLIPLSFYFLVLFGVTPERDGRRGKTTGWLPEVLFVAWLALTLLSSDRLLWGDVLGRYLLGLPGAMLTGWAFLRHAPELESHGSAKAAFNLRASALIFALYGVLSGLVVPSMDFFPANVLNYALFTETIGVPVQIFRTLCALLALVSTGAVLRIFSWEKEVQLYEREEQYRSLVELDPNGIAIIEDGAVRFINHAGARLLGADSPAELIEGQGSYAREPRSVNSLPYRLGETNDDKNTHSSPLPGMEEVELLRLDGSTFEADASVVPFRYNRKPAHQVVFRDATERNRLIKKLERYRGRLEEIVQDRTMELLETSKHLEAEIGQRKFAESRNRQSETFLNSVFASINDPFCIFDADLRIIKVNPAYCQMKNRPPEKLIGLRCRDVISEDCPDCDICIAEKTKLSGDALAKEERHRTSMGEDHWYEVFTYPIHDTDGNLTHVAEQARDITDRKKIEADRDRLIRQLKYTSFTDGLTQVMNRRALTERLDTEIDRSRRYNTPLSIVLCDLDFFKEINDSHGHELGDVALRVVAETLSGSVRRSDAVGRYGGDEFMIVLPEIVSEDAIAFAERIREEASQAEIQLTAERSLHLSLSLGVATFRPGDQVDDLVRRADAALYESKRGGRNRVSISPMPGDR